MNPITQFLINIFQSLNWYSRENGLGQHLKGLNIATCEGFTGQNIYGLVFIFFFVINTAIVVNYYYGLFNRVPCNTWGWYLLNLFFGALIMFLIAFTYAHHDLVDKHHCRDLVFDLSDCLGFGFTAAFWSVCWSVLVSYVIKWKSSVNRSVNPFYFI